MSAARFLQFFKLCRTHNPAHERQLFKEAANDKVRRIVEIGVRDGQRAKHLISVARRVHDAEEIRYAGIDLFESNEAGVPLKEMHRQLSATGVNLRLIPGSPVSALQRAANDLRGTDWVVIGGEIARTEMDAAWHFLPRMLHQNSKVWIESPQRDAFQVQTARDVSQQLTARSKNRRRGAA